MLMRFDPFRELDRMTQQALNGSTRSPVPMDAYRHGEDLVVHFDLPGVDADSIELTVEKNVLTVKAERQWHRQEGDDWIVHERPSGSFTRQLFLGDGLDTDQIRASYDRGVLSITIPVAEKAKPRKVEVQTGSAAPKAVEATSAA